MKLLLGYGNTMRQDDGAGWLVASQLAPLYHDTDVVVCATHQLMPEHAARVAQAEQVIFVDASVMGPAGQVHIQSIQPATYLNDAHTLQPADILYLAEVLYGHSPSALLVTIAGVEFGLGDQLSATTLKAIPTAVAQIKRLLQP